MMLAVFVLVILSTTGIGLLFLSQNEVKMSQADLRSKEAFYLAEAGEEFARTLLFSTNGGGLFDDELTTGAGLNGAFDFDPSTVLVNYDSNGNVTGLANYGDDEPLVSLSAFGGGWYAAFLTNDAGEAGSLTDGNDWIIVTGLGMGSGRSLEVVQAIIERSPLVRPPSTITILGPSPAFDGGTSESKLYAGDDCADPSYSVPVVGVIGSSAEASAETGITKPETYISGTNIGVDTVEDVDAIVDPRWKSCQYWHDLASTVKESADVIGDTNTPNTELGTAGDPKIVFIDGDYIVGGGVEGEGMLWVTGDLNWDGSAAFAGTIYAVGTGVFLRNGGGDGTTSGAVVVANVAGPDGFMGTADDCSGPDGISGNSDDGLAAGSYLNNGAGTHTTRFCLDAINTAEFPYSIVNFHQL